MAESEALDRLTTTSRVNILLLSFKACLIIAFVLQTEFYLLYTVKEQFTSHINIQLDMISIPV